jgi:hypothetical protein
MGIKLGIFWGVLFRRITMIFDMLMYSWLLVFWCIPFSHILSSRAQLPSNPSPSAWEFDIAIPWISQESHEAIHQLVFFTFR